MKFVLGSGIIAVHTKSRKWLNVSVDEDNLVIFMNLLSQTFVAEQSASAFALIIEADVCNWLL